MPEFVHAKRGLEGTIRVPHHLQLCRGVCFGIAPWPFNCSLLLTFDCEGTFGGGKTDKGETELVPELASLFHELKIQATFNFLGKIAEEYPEILDKVKSFNQEISGHGYSHGNLDGLSFDQQHEEIEKNIISIEKACGKRIVGFRSPYGTFDLNTYKVLTKLNFKWTSNFGRSLWGDYPFIVSIENNIFPIIDIPFDDIHFDAWIFKRHNIQFDQALLLYKNHLIAAQRNNSIFTLLAHPAGLVLERHRADVVIELAKHASLSNKIWTTSSNNLATRWDLLRNINWRVNQFNPTGDNTEYEIIIKNNNNIEIDNLVLIITHHKNISKVISDNDWIYDEGAVNPKSKLLLRAEKINALSTTTTNITIS